jgi:hypothetical protein
VGEWAFRDANQYFSDDLDIMQESIEWVNNNPVVLHSQVGSTEEKKEVNSRIQRKEMQIEGCCNKTQSKQPLCWLIERIVELI